jgi:hypothetical protein
MIKFKDGKIHQKKKLNIDHPGNEKFGLGHCQKLKTNPTLRFLSYGFAYFE